MKEQKTAVRIDTLVEQLRQKYEQLEELQREESLARQATTACKNKINDLQKSIDRVVEDVKAKSPRDTRQLSAIRIRQSDAVQLESVEEGLELGSALLGGFGAGLLHRRVVGVVHCLIGQPGRDGLVRQLLDLPASSTCNRLKGAVRATFQDHRLHRLLL